MAASSSAKSAKSAGSAAKTRSARGGAEAKTAAVGRSAGAAKEAGKAAGGAGAGKAAGAAKSGTPATVTLKHLAARLSEDHEMSRKQTEAVLGDMVQLVVRHLKKGDRIRIGGLGILQVKKRAARMGLNPATGEQIKIKASKKVGFRASKELKEAV